MAENISKEPRKTKAASNKSQLPKKTKLKVRVLSDNSRFEEKEKKASIPKKEIKATPIKKETASKENKEFKKFVTTKIDKKSKPETKEDKQKSIGLYRSLALTFIAFTIILLAGVFYVYFVGLTVEVTPKKERISDKATFVVKNGEATADVKDSVGGVIEQIPITEEKVYQATGADILGQEIVGKVTLYNDQAKPQTLVATTRVMSPDGKIFRIKNSVNIPANSSQEVEIYTDEPSQDLAIGPTSFTLPALWAGLQDKVYAKSTEAFVYNTQVKKYVQQIDIDNGLEDLKKALMDKANQQFSNNYKGFDKVILQIDKGSFDAKVSAKAKDNVDQFTITINTLIDVVAFNKKDAEKLVGGKLVSVIPDDKKLIGLESSDVDYSLDNIDFNAKQATINASFSGSITAKKVSDLIDKSKLIGLNKDQISNYLNNLDRFSDFKINFTPGFMKTAPTLVDRIKIIVKDPK